MLAVSPDLKTCTPPLDFALYRSFFQSAYGGFAESSHAFGHLGESSMLGHAFDPSFGYGSSRWGPAWWQ